MGMPAVSPTPHADADPPRAPDFELADQNGRPWRLSDHLGAGYLVVVFYRGHWCPYCRRYLAKLRDHLPRFRERDARLVAVSPEPPATARALAADLALPFPLLSDAAGEAIDRYATRNGFRHAGPLLPHPSVFVLDPHGVVRFRSIDRNYKKRTTMRTLLRVLDELAAAAPSPV